MKFSYSNSMLIIVVVPNICLVVSSIPYANTIKSRHFHETIDPVSLKVTWSHAIPLAVLLVTKVMDKAPAETWYKLISNHTLNRFCKSMV